MKARHVPDLHNQYEGEPGDWCLYTTATGRQYFWFVCPGPCRQLSCLHLNEGPPNRIWNWDSNLAAPTLTPSINHVDCWHGWLRAGEFTPC